MVFAMYGRTNRLLQHGRLFVVMVLAITTQLLSADEFEAARQQLVLEIHADVMRTSSYIGRDSFNEKVMTAIGQAVRHHEIIHDDTPIELYAADIVDRLERDGSMSFAEIFAGRTNRGQIVGLLLALLELVRRRRILAGQEANFGLIHIRLNPDPPTEEDPEPI